MNPMNPMNPINPINPINPKPDLTRRVPGLQPEPAQLLPGVSAGTAGALRTGYMGLETPGFRV